MRASGQAKVSAADAPGERGLKTGRGPLPILVWTGRPMHIDSAWEEVFVARERIGAAYAKG
jgi:hypothetical protein